MIMDFYASLSPRGLFLVEILQLLAWVGTSFYLWNDYGMLKRLCSKNPEDQIIARMGLVVVIVPAFNMLSLIVRTV